MIASETTLLLLNNTQVIPRSQHHEEESALLRGKMEELNRNTVRLISEAEKLIQESKQLSERIKSFRGQERTSLMARSKNSQLRGYE
jgi:predicted  nucleic acid-binding Zn-ribbon protein